jgi:hypothetical protein
MPFAEESYANRWRGKPFPWTETALQAATDDADEIDV